MTAWRRADGVVFERSGDRVVLLDRAGTTLVTLNPVGSLIWQELDGRREAAELAAALVDRLTGVTEEQLAGDIDEFLAELGAEGLVEEGHADG